jgi:hypothetical protein
MGQHSQIMGAVLNCPHSIPALFRTYNKQIVHHQLHHLLNRRIGIEIECGGTMIPWSNKLALISDREYFFLSLAKKYGVYSIDFAFPENEREYDFYKENINEHRISILNYTQLSGLFDILEDIKKNCIFSTSGIHIHIDAEDLFNKKPSIFMSDNDYLYKLKLRFELYLDKLEDIFGKYTGTFNSKGVGREQKSSWINLRYGSYKTIEFRIAPMTFDYETIVKWCIACTKIVNEVKSKC